MSSVSTTLSDMCVCACVRVMCADMCAEQPEADKKVYTENKCIASKKAYAIFREILQQLAAIKKL